MYRLSTINYLIEFLGKQVDVFQIWSISRKVLVIRGDAFQLLTILIEILVQNRQRL